MIKVNLLFGRVVGCKMQHKPIVRRNFAGKYLDIAVVKAVQRKVFDMGQKYFALFVQGFQKKYFFLAVDIIVLNTKGKYTAMQLPLTFKH